MKLTDRKNSLLGAEASDLIHIVKTGDTSQNSAGSSYKIEVGDYKSLFSFTGGIVTGDTIFNGGITANTINSTTISATTYLGLPTDTFISGMTFNTGNYDLTLNRNDGVNFTQSLSILASDMNVTGGTYNTSTGTATFTNNSGGTFDVTGFLSPNLQKTITTSYLLTSDDNNYTILIDNDTTPITITVPTGLISKINVGFIQQGTGDVSFVTSGTIIRTPLVGAFKIKGQNYNAYLEQIDSTNDYHLLGNLKV